MTVNDYQKKSPLAIFLSYFKNHKGLFALDISCAVIIGAIDLTFPLVTQYALKQLLPHDLYQTFFTIIIACNVSVQTHFFNQSFSLFNSNFKSLCQSFWFFITA